MAKKTYRDWERRRQKYIAETDNQFLKKIDKLQGDFYKVVRDYLDQSIDIKDNQITSTTRNYAAINSLSSLKRKFRKNYTDKTLMWMGRRFAQILTLNTAYFGSQAVLSKNIRSTVRNRLLTQLGLRILGNTVNIRSGGWLDTLGEFSDPYMRVQEVAINAVSNGMRFEDLRKQIRDAILLPSRSSIRHHFYTNAYDSFNQFDRVIGKEYAERLQFRAFRYSGGIIDTSRDFCKERNRKVFTLEEAKQWSTMNWDGKKEPYDPIRDLGGWGCRHTANFISDQRAIRLRPELKDIWGL